MKGMEKKTEENLMTFWDAVDCEVVVDGYDTYHESDDYFFYSRSNV